MNIETGQEPVINDYENENNGIDDLIAKMEKVTIEKPE